MRIDLLDCTIREAPLKELYFGEAYIQKFINGLEKSNINIIECGFLKNGQYTLGSTIFSKVEQIEPYLRHKKKNTLYVALVDYGRFDLENLTPYNKKSIDGIRICFKKAEKDKVFDYAKAIKDKGYKVFFQHVDTLDYTDIEIIELLQKVNELKPYAYSIVDTFGSMYADDVTHLYSLVNRHLNLDIKLGFHTHNNLMLAVANSQLFITLAYATRDIMVDGSVLGCGRGAGNTNLECLAQFINQKFQGKYNLDELFDLIDTLMPKLQKECKWGYDIPYFLSGIHSSHVFNVNHILRRHNILSKDLRAIIEKLDTKQKKQYDYKLLEKLYVEHIGKKVDDSKNLKELKNIIKKRQILFLLPGSSLIKYKNKIKEFIAKNKPLVVSLNNYNQDFQNDIVFFSSIRRYLEYEKLNLKNDCKILITSNIKTKPKNNEFIINYLSLIKFGWINLDASVILALRLFIKQGVKDIFFAGFDGFNAKNKKNYYNDVLENTLNKDELLLISKDVKEMLDDLLKEHHINATFLTPSIYEDNFKGLKNV